MKKLLFSLIVLLMYASVSAQIVTIPDANFQAQLLQADSTNQIAKDLNGVYFKIDANNDSQIQTSEALQVSYLSISTIKITSIVGISGFTNLLDLEFQGSAGSQVSTVDVTALSKLKILNCSYSGVQTVNVTGLTSLEQIDCRNNALTALDVSSLTNLKILTCGSFFSVPLTSLDLSNLTNLEQLDCSGYDNLTVLRCSKNKLAQLSLINLPSLATLEITQNPLTALSVSLLTNLQNLNCSGNQLQSLDVSNLSKLQSLNCSNNKLTSLYIKNGVNESTLDFSANPGLTYVCADASQISGVQTLVNSYGYTNCVVNSTCTSSADIVVIPDVNFKAKLLASSTSNSIARDFNGFPLKIDANNDGEIQISEALQVRDLDVSHDFSNTNPFVTSLEGILSFSNLNSLACTDNQLTSLNVSGLTNLVTLNCAANILKSMNLSGLTNLENLNCGGTGNQFGTLDLSPLTKLTTVSCAFNGLSSLNVSGLTNLINLDCGFNNFITLDLSSLINLQTLSCTNTQLLSLVLSGLTKLHDLQCSNNGNLNDLHLSGNQLTTLNLTSLPNLFTLDCTLNHLTALDLSGVPSIQNLNLSGNQLQTLDLTKQTNLQSLICSNNQLTSLFIMNGVNEGNLDMSGNPGLLHVCADPAQISFVQSLVTSYGYVNCVVDSNCSSSSSNIVFIPDVNFKAKLLSADSTNSIAQDLNGVNFKIDANNDGEIQLSEAAQVSDLDVNTSNISSLEGILSFTNLSILVCNMNKLTALNITPLTKLQFIRCSDNQLTTLDLSGLTNLVELHCSTNAFTALNISGVLNLQVLHCEVNNLTTLDATALNNLKELYCYKNQLTSLFIKNGSNENLDISNNPNLQFICADDFQLVSVQNEIAADGYSNCTLSTYCSFTPGGQFYTVQGNNRIDLTGNGCDATDMPISNPKFTITNGSSTETAIADATGLYNFPVEQGTHTITPVLENPSYFNVSPTSVTVTFPTQVSPLTQDFCYTKNGIHADLEVFLIPVMPAVPGFDATFRIIYKNKGNQTLSGNVNLVFNDSVLDFVSSTPGVSNQSLNNLSWNFTALQPFETRVIVFTLNVNSSTETPAVMGGDILNYNATISSSVTDETPNDNTFALTQTVLSSFDPNDKVCLEGNIIEPSRIGDYLHYMIRFKNTGTYPAKSIVVADMIDTSKFDIASLIPMNGSHPFVTRITDTNKVEFIFENINLPFDDANSDGYVAFKIKTLPLLVLGNTVSNTASIYFDYNKPIVTNTTTATIAALTKQDFTFSNYFSVYPNPVKDVLNISKSESIELSSISIYNVLGQVMMVIPNAQNISRVDVSNLGTGIYFIKINTDKGISNARFIKK